MASFAHQPPPPAGSPPQPQPIHSEEDLTHRVHGPIGDMTVVPDDYVGPMPANAVRRTDYQRMTSVYGHIDSGDSQLKIDTSSFFKGADGKDLSLMDDPVAYVQAMAAAGQFRSQYMGYIQDLVKTPAGLQMLEHLDTSKFSTTIERGQGGNVTTPADGVASHEDEHTGAPGAGTSTRISVDPNATEWDGETCTQGHKPWMVDRPRLGFYHELVHSYYDTQGTAAWAAHPQGHGFSSCGGPGDLAWPVFESEWQTAGLGPYAGNSISENAIRRQMGVPERETYDGHTYEDWNQQRDAEDPPRPHR